MEAVTSSLRLASSSSLVTVSEKLKLRVENFAGGKAYLGITFESLTLKCGCERWSNGAFQVAVQAAAAEVAANAASPMSRCECHDLFEHLVPYVEAWRWQKETLDRISTSLSKGEEPPNSVVLLQHPPVYTMGTRSSDVYLRFDKNHPPFELHQTERGGEVTYHGPGQLVMYPILNLRRQRMDLHWYLRMLEEVVIRALWSSCGLRASRVEGLTGVWVGAAKVAAIGVRVSRWITYHGLALNVNTDLAPFQNIVPCGIGDRPVGSIKQLLHNIQLNSSRRIRPLQTFEGGGWHDLLEDAMILDRVHESLLLEFAEVFQMDLITPINEGPKCVLHPQTDLHEENFKRS